MIIRKSFHRVLFFAALHVPFLFFGLANGTEKLHCGAALEAAPRVLIFFSSLGGGHISAAQATSNAILEKNPSAVVILKDIREFLPPHLEKASRNIWWFITKRFPDLFDKLYQAKMRTGNQAHRISDLGQGDYEFSKVLSYIQEISPSAILTTHFGASETLGAIRARGELAETRLGWIHTDYIVGYFPRNSARIDFSALPEPSLAPAWANRGVNPDLVAVTGIPNRAKEFPRVDKNRFFSEKGLDPSVPLITLSSGSEGVGDFPKMVRSLARASSQPLQIVAVCGRNERHFQALQKLRPRLPAQVSLRIERFVPQNELFGFIQHSSVYITKSGGLSPTEAFMIGVPTVLLDVYGGHERENALLFEQLGLALVNRNQGEIRQEVRRILRDEKLRESVLAAQADFSSRYDLSPIVDFALNGTTATSQMPARHPSKRYDLEISVYYEAEKGRARERALMVRIGEKNWVSTDFAPGQLATFDSYRLGVTGLTTDQIARIEARLNDLNKKQQRIGITGDTIVGLLGSAGRRSGKISLLNGLRALHLELARRGTKADLISQPAQHNPNPARRVLPIEKTLLPNLRETNQGVTPTGLGFEPAPSDISLTIDIDLEAELLELRQEETELETLFRDLETSGHSSRSFMQRFDQNVDADYLGELDDRLKHFQSRLDAHTLRRLKYFLLLSVSRFRKLTQEIAPTLVGETLKKWKLYNHQIEYAAKSYLQAQHLLGDPLDSYRSYAYKNAFTTIRKALNLLPTNEAKRRGKIPVLAQFGWRAQKMYRDVLKAFGGLWRWSGRTIPQGKTPFNQYFDEMIRSIMNRNGISVTVEGRENLSKLETGNRVVTLYTPLHTSPIPDLFTLVSLGLSDYAIFGAFYEFAPYVLAKKLDQIENFIAVGNGRDKPIEKALFLLKERGIHQFVIYPEGSIAVSGFETRPLRERFASGLVRRLLEEGYQVQMVPVVYPRNGSLMNDPMTFVGPHDLRNLTTRVMRPIDAATVAAIYRERGPETLSRILRQVWLDNLETNDSLFLSSPRPDEFQDYLNTYFGGKLNGDSSSDR